MWVVCSWAGQKGKALPWKPVHVVSEDLYCKPHFSLFPSITASEAAYLGQRILVFFLFFLHEGQVCLKNNSISANHQSHYPVFLPRSALGPTSFDENFLTHALRELKLLKSASCCKRGLRNLLSKATPGSRTKDVIGAKVEEQFYDKNYFLFH